VTTFLIEARDPLIFRDGRPNDGRSESRTLDFPTPSVLIGAIRTQLGRSGGAFNPSLIPQLLKQVSLRGPLLASDSGLFVSAPADALMLKLDDGSLHLKALRPIALPEGARSSLGAEGLVGLPDGENERAKPHAEAPRLWCWRDTERWLQNPEVPSADVPGLCERGLRALPREERIHVALGPDGTAEDGKLFAAEGLRLFAGSSLGPTGKIPEELSFLIDLEVRAPELGAMTPGLRPLGGERRLARWRVAEKPALPKTPDWLLEHVRQDTSSPPVVRVLLLTPAFVKQSLAPDCLSSNGARVIAAKVDRPRTISGWDMSTNLPHGAPKKTRRLAAAGSVYWVELSGDAQARRRWVEENWMQNIGDDEQLRRDGFGLAALGIGRRA